MPLMHKRCAEPGCRARPQGPRCQDCGRVFCGDHIAAVDFSGFRRGAVTQSDWTRFVCVGCAARADRLLVATATRRARQQADLDARGHWWSLLPVPGEASW